MLEAMKANMKMSEALNAKLQKKIEMEKKILAMSSDAAMNVDPSVCSYGFMHDPKFS